MTERSFPNQQQAALALLNDDSTLTRKAGSFLGQLVADPGPLSDAQAKAGDLARSRCLAPSGDRRRAMTNEPDLFGFTSAPEYPDAPGHRGVETSIAAAVDIAPKLGRLQRMAEEAIRAAGYYGVTADELAANLDVSRWTIQPRTTELKLKGLVVDSGMRRPNCTGKSAIVWVAFEYRRSAAANPPPPTPRGAIASAWAPTARS
jgi:hypothetical protein